ncbi:hypothetical protein GS860_16190 [Rhodococcus hoagii]|nr:hypothetical protein [Prescottella equi]
MSGINRNVYPELFRDAHKAEAAAKDKLAEAITEARTRVFDRDLLILVNDAYGRTRDHNANFFSSTHEPSDEAERELENALIAVENRCQQLLAGPSCLPAVTPQMTAR